MPSKVQGQGSNDPSSLDPATVAPPSSLSDVLGGAGNMFDMEGDMSMSLGDDLSNLNSGWDPTTPNSNLSHLNGFGDSPAPTISSDTTIPDFLSPNFSPYRAVASNADGSSGLFDISNMGLLMPEFSQMSPDSLGDVSDFSPASGLNLHLSPLSGTLDSLLTPIDSVSTPALNNDVSLETYGLMTPGRSPRREVQEGSSGAKPKAITDCLLSPANSTSRDHHRAFSPLSSNPIRADTTPSPEMAPAPKAQERKTKKRKMTEDEEEDEDEDEDEEMDDGEGSASGKGKPKKTAHNVIEKRYRTNLNQKFAILRDSVPSLRVMSRARRARAVPGAGDRPIKSGKDVEDLDGLAPAHKLNKATVLSKAVEYIVHLEKRNNKLSDEVKMLKSQVHELERVSMSGMMGGLDSFPEWSPGEVNAEDDISLDLASSSIGLIPMSEEMQRLRRRRAPVPATVAPEATPISRAKKQSHLASRMILGSLAGLVVLEGAGSDGSGNSSDGMSAIPLPWLEGFAYPRLGVSISEALHLLRVLLAFVALSAIIFPFLSSFTRRRHNSSRSSKVLEKDRVVSVAKHHQKAFLAAAQTLRFPAAGVFSEGLSVLSEIGNILFSRQSFGRRKTWDMAVDSQLMGGDPHMSTGRLVLGIVGGLSGVGSVSSSTRYVRHLMRLSLQLRITGAGSTDRLGRLASSWFWRQAQEARAVESNAEVAAAAGGSGSGSEHDSGSELGDGQPNHVMSLLALDYDRVFSAVVVGRAIRMVWSHTLSDLRPRLSSRFGLAMGIEDSLGVTAWLDEALYDEAVVSPLDLIAAWVSAMELHFALMGFLSVAMGLPVQEEIGGNCDGGDVATLSGDGNGTTFEIKSPELREPSDGREGVLPPQPIITSDEKLILTSLDTALRVAPPGSAMHLRVLAAKGVLDSEGGERLEQLRSIIQARTVIRGRIEGRKIPTDVSLGMELGECVVDAETVLEAGISDRRSEAGVSVAGYTAEALSDSESDLDLKDSYSVKAGAAEEAALYSPSSDSPSLTLSHSSSPSSCLPASLNEKLSSLAVLFSSPSITSNHSLLSLAAAHTALHTLSADDSIRSDCRSGLERLASGIRDLVGRQSTAGLLNGPSSTADFGNGFDRMTGAPGLAGLSDRLRARLVDDCLDVTRVLVGLENGDQV